MEIFFTCIIWVVLAALVYYLLDWSLGLFEADTKFRNLAKGLILLALLFVLTWTIYNGYSFPAMRLRR